MESYGLVIIADGKKYGVPSAYEPLIPYPIGGLICEYLRMSPGLLKALFQKYPDKDLPITDESLQAAISWMNERIFYGLLPAQSGIIMGEVMNNHQLFVTAEKEQREGLAKHLNTITTIPDQVKQFFLEGTGKHEFCLDSVGDYLTCLMGIVGEHFITAYKTISEVVQKKPSAYDVIYELMNERLAEQDISYRIVYFNDKFTPAYTIKNGVSLLLFEAVNMIENNVEIRVCKNCDNFFIPTGRKDARYCTYLSPQDKTKTCKQIGARAARKEKEHNDPVTREYRKKYLRLTMAVRRNPGNQEKEAALQKYVEEADIWKKKIADGRATEDEFLAWICAPEEAEQ